MNEPVKGEVHVTVQRKPFCQVQLDVKTSQNLVAQGRKEAIKAVGKDVSLPGFRKGKAPEEWIVKKFPHEVDRQLHKVLANLAFEQAQKIVNIPPLTQHTKVNFDLKTQTEEGAELVFTYETEPVVPTVDPTQFHPSPVNRLEVGEKQIDEAVRQMRFFYADWKSVADRGIEEGDFVIIDLDTVEGDTVHRVFNQIRFEVVPERMANWMRQLVLQAKAGDVLEGVSEPDEGVSEEEKAQFTPKKVRLHVLKVEQATLPALDDEFAKKVGATDVATMRTNVANILETQAKDQVQKVLREQVTRFLVQQYPFDLPHSQVEEEKNFRLHQQKQNPKWEKMSDEEKQRVETALVEEASQAVRLFYLSRQIVRDAKIPVSHKQVQDEAVALLQAHGVRNIEIKNIAKEVFALALSQVILKKAQDFILQSQKT